LDSLSLPKTDAELRRLSRAIASGQREVVTPHEVETVMTFLSAAIAFQRRWTLPRVLLLWVLPVFLLLVFVGYLFKVILQS